MCRLLLLFILLLCSGCSTLWTQKAQYAGVARMLAQGDFSAAKNQIENSLYYYSGKDEVLRLLDLGLLEHYLGDYEASNRSLNKAEQLMDAAFTKSVTRGAASLLLNDNVLTYAGEDYEAIYVNVFKALNFLNLDDFDSAFVEIRRVDEKLKVLESRYWKIARAYDEASEMDQSFEVGKNRFQDSVLARWLSLLIYRAEGRPDEAAIDLKKIDRARVIQPDLYNFSGADLSSALSPPKTGTVLVPLLAFTGQAPEKRADTFWIHTQADQLFIGTSREARYGGQRLRGANVIYWPGIEPGYTFKFQLPRLEKRASRVSRVRVSVDGATPQWLEPIERLENSADATFEIQKPLTYLKTISRTVTKGIAAAQAQQAAEARWGEAHGLLAGLLAGAGLAVTENADLRISRFFPAEARIGELELTPGVHQIRFEYFGPGGTLLHSDSSTVNVRNSGVNLVESFYLN